MSSNRNPDLVYHHTWKDGTVLFSPFGSHVNHWLYSRGDRHMAHIPGLAHRLVIWSVRFPEDPGIRGQVECGGGPAAKITDTEPCYGCMLATGWVTAVLTPVATTATAALPTSFCPTTVATSGAPQTKSSMQGGVSLISLLLQYCLTLVLCYSVFCWHWGC